MEKKRFYTVVGYIVKDQRVLLVFNNKVGNWVAPGGKIDPNETPDDAVKREFKEETNLSVTPYPLSPFTLYDGKDHLAIPFNVHIHDVRNYEHINFSYLCHLDKDEEIILEADKIAEYKWFSKEDLLATETLIPNVRQESLYALENSTN